MISCIPALSAFFIGTVMKSRFYSSIQYGLMYGGRRSDKFRTLPKQDDSNKDKTKRSSSLGHGQPNSSHSAKSLVGSGKNIAIIEMPELEPKTTTQVSSYRTLGKQELGQMGVGSQA